MTDHDEHIRRMNTLGNTALGLAADIRQYDPHKMLDQILKLQAAQPVFCAQLMMALAAMVDVDQPMSVTEATVWSCTKPIPA